MTRIFLLGYMGAGKTTLGQRLADVLHLSFIDLDHFITARQHKSVTQIFAEQGEAAFRQMERRALAEVADYEDVIVALGGGTPCHFDNMDVINAHGTSVYLKVDDRVLLERLVLARDSRPLIAGKTDSEILDIIRAQMAVRAPYYERALLTFDASRLADKREVSLAADALARLIRPTDSAARDAQG